MKQNKNIVVVLLAPFFLSASMLVPISGSAREIGHCLTFNSRTQFLPRPQGLNSAVFFNPYYYNCCDRRVRHVSGCTGYRYNQDMK